jgi:hypothetical protein
LWFEKFAGHDYLREFGYLTNEALKLDPYREKMALRLAYFALFALQQHKNGRYQIVTLLKRLGYEQEIESAKTDRVAALHLKRSFDRATQTLGSFQYAYKFDYDPDVPQWVDTDKKLKKPQGWFEIWLQLHGTLSQPEVLPKRKPEPSKRETPPQTPVEAKQAKSSQKSNSVQSNGQPSSSKPFGQRVREARLSKGESLRAMAKELKISPSRLSQIQNDRYPHKLQPSLIAEILAYVGLED